MACKHLRTSADNGSAMRPADDGHLLGICCANAPHWVRHGVREANAWSVSVALVWRYPAVTMRA